MKAIVAAFTLSVTLAVTSVPEARMEYFRHMRQVHTTAPDRQNYASVDETIWKAARPDLGDLRLYANNREVPYSLTVQRARDTVTQVEVKLLNIGRVNGETEFMLDLTGVPEYNELTLRFGEDARDFVVRARVEGLEEPRQRKGVDLGSSTLFDLSREKLGSNSTLKLLRPARFGYLRVRVPQISPQQVVGASVSDTRRRPSAWTPLSLSPRVRQEGRTTVIDWDADEHVPLARVSFVIEPQQVNFRREVEIQDADAHTIVSGEISRIHLARDHRTVDSECLQLNLGETRSTKFRVVVQNGDDPALPIMEVKAFALERRLYFDPKGAAVLDLYYDDPSLTAPVYDYAKVMVPDAHAVAATLGPSQQNGAYTGRPDQRPWTERHPVVLWAALVLAVLGLGAIAIRGLATVQKQDG